MCKQARSLGKASVLNDRSKLIFQEWILSSDNQGPMMMYEIKTGPNTGHVLIYRNYCKRRKGRWKQLSAWKRFPQRKRSYILHQAQVECEGCNKKGRRKLLTTRTRFQKRKMLSRLIIKMKLRRKGSLSKTN